MIVAVTFCGMFGMESTDAVAISVPNRNLSCDDGDGNGDRTPGVYRAGLSGIGAPVSTFCKTLLIKFAAAAYKNPPRPTCPIVLKAGIVESTIESVAMIKAVRYTSGEVAEKVGDADFIKTSMQVLSDVSTRYVVRAMCYG